MDDFRINLQGQKDFTRRLKEVDKALGKELRQIHLQVAKTAEARTHAAMQAGGDGRATKGVKGRATQKQASLTTQGTARVPWVNAAIWGTKKRTGWYAQQRYRGSTRQHKPWVGNQWEPGANGGKPYYLGAAVNATVDEAIELYGDGIYELARRAGFR